jgi:hypothetical protein
MLRDTTVMPRPRHEQRHPWMRCHLALPIEPVRDMWVGSREILRSELDVVHDPKVSRSDRRASAWVSLIVPGRCLRLLVSLWSGRYAVFSSVAIPVCGSP